MSVWKTDRKLPDMDVRADRIGAGTIGGDHIVKKGLGSQGLSTIIDDADPRIVYGIYTPAGWTTGDVAWYGGTTPFVHGTTTILGGGSTFGVEGMCAQLQFTGTTIGVLASTNVQTGLVRIYIDGVETKGRLGVYASCGVTSGFVGNAQAPTITSTATSFVLSGGVSGFPASGYLSIGSEIIQYTSLAGVTFSGLTRGALGTTAQDHYANETAYLWDSKYDYNGTLLSGTFSFRELVYYNPFLPPGQHTITVVAERGAGPYARLFFDGFVVGKGGLVGSDNVSLQYGSIKFLSVTTDGNGHCDLGSLTSRNNDTSFLTIIGYTQSNTETTNTTALSQLGYRYNGISWLPYLYVHNGPPSTTFDLTVHYLGMAASL